MLRVLRGFDSLRSLNPFRLAYGSLNAPRSSRELNAPRSSRELNAPRSSRELNAPRSSRELNAPRSSRGQCAQRHQSSSGVTGRWRLC